MDIHVVQPGDTIYRLAQQYGVSMERLLQDNQLPDPSHLVWVRPSWSNILN